MSSDSLDHDTHALFAGESEIAALMHALDWSTTPVGRPERWAQSLRAPVRIVLTSRFAMWMGWGDELTFFYNDAYARILGAKHPWALGRPAREVWAEIWSQIEPRIDQVLRTGAATWDERLLLFLERSGFSEETYHTFSYSPLADDAGTTSGLLCVVSEETERVIGERRLSLLHELAAQLSAADSVADVLAAVQASLGKDARDLPFTLTHVLGGSDEPAERVALTGMTHEHPAVEVTGAHAGPSPRFWPVAQVLSEGSWVVVELSPELEWPRGPWEQAPTHAVVVPIPQRGQAEPAGVFIAGLNRFRPFDEAYRNFLGLFVGQLAAGLANARAYATERRRAEALAELDRAKTTFFSNISHEFRTPLTLMLGPTEDALSARRALAGTDLESVHRNQLRLLKLVNTLLDFSRIEAGRVAAAYQALDLAALTSELAGTFRSTVERAGLRLVVSTEPLAESVFVDPQMWERILLNLLSNAFKFTFEGAITVRLHAPEQGWVRLSVTDTGVGIPEHELARVFERFHRIEGTRSRTHEGSGIGLALVSDLVRLHGGRIAVTSRVDHGTTFTVDVPTGSAHVPSENRSVAEAREARVSAAPFVSEALRWLHDDGAPPAGDGSLDEGLPPPSAAEHKGRILVVDDNADMRAYLTSILRQRWVVETAADGALALTAARLRRPDLIVTDVMMPMLDGMGLVAAIREDPALRGVPIVMLSARAGEEARIEGIQAGADDYLVKPFSARELVARVGTRLELYRLGRRLANERAAIAQLFEQTPMPVAILKGDDLVFETANARYVSVVGGRSLVGKPLLVALPELAGQGLDELLKSVLRTGVAHVGHEQLIRIERDGSLVDTYWTFIYAPVRADDGNIDSVIALCNDVTEQVVARQRVEGLALEAARANRTKDEFLAMLGHELRNPLAPMLTALQLLRLRGRESREQDVLERQVAHLSRMVDDLLDVSRITRGKIELHRRGAELSEIVQRAMEMASPLLEETHHDVDLHVAAAGLGVHVDVDRMAQVVYNLLTNGAKYSTARSRIIVRGVASEGLVRLSVKDEGIGIAPEMLDRVFEAFVQQPQSIERSRGGLGLGLTIVRSLVEMHDGRVRVKSAGEGQGSEFIVELPAARVKASAPARAVGSPSSARAGAGTSRRILVVDDNQDAAEMLGAALESMGHVVALAHDGPSALRVSGSFKPELALLDIGLPVMDGYELAQRLREQHLTPAPNAHLQLIAITGYGQDADRERSARAGFEAHLVKPLDLDHLARAIDAASRSRSAD